ncbi:hypothetical protein GALL_168470 [mine drainage metagenome]|uniref:Uncharacterized protein n=1 Tax=mine drainage metagenome TaxID=410659 RepID=A0A1J5RYW5_9ZZZZ
MLVPDMPNVPPQNVPVMIAQANQAQPNDVTTIRTLGVCHPAPNHNYSLDNVEDPILSASNYMQAFENKTVTGPATTVILQLPKHGVLRLVTEADRGTLFGSTADPLDPADALYAYLPEDGYVGNDSATIQVDFGNGLKVNVKYCFQAISGVLGNTGLEDLCSKTGVYWKISSTLAPNGTSTITSVDYQTPATLAAEATSTNVAALASWINTTDLRLKGPGSINFSINFLGME